MQQADGHFPVFPRDRQLTNGSQTSTLEITPDLLALFVRCDVREGGETASSDLVMAPPASTGGSIVRGYAVESEYLTCDGRLRGTAQDSNGDGLRRTTFFRDGVVVYDRPAHEAAHAPYRLTAADTGHQITCRESGWNAGGFGAAPISAPVTPVACSATAPPFCLPADFGYQPHSVLPGFPDGPAPCSGCSPVRSTWARLVANSKVFAPGWVRTSAYKTGATSAHVHVEVRTALTEPANVRVGVRSCRTMGTHYCDDYTAGVADGAYEIVARPAGPWVADFDYDVHDIAGGDISAILWQVGWLDSWVQTFWGEVRFKCASWCGDDFVPIDAT